MIYASAYQVGDLVLVDPTTEYKFSGEIVQIIRVVRRPYGVSYDVTLPNDPWKRSTYKEQYLLPIQTTTTINNKQEANMETFKKMVKAQEMGNTTVYDLALYGYDNATDEELAGMKGKFIVAHLVNRGFRLLQVTEVQNNDDVTARVPGEVVSFVDTADYDARMANRQKKAELRKKMDAVIASKSELQTYQKYAELFPDVAELFNEYKEL